MIDRQQIRQAMINLVKNAVEALQDNSEQTAPEITLSVETKINDITLSVMDNGPGWPEHLMGQLFDPYITTKESGTGLGLAIVAKIIEDHGGTLSLASTQERGASIHITLPISMEKGV